MEDGGTLLRFPVRGRNSSLLKSCQKFSVISAFQLVGKWLNRSKCDCDQVCPSAPQVRNIWIYISKPHMILRTAQGKIYTFYVWYYAMQRF